MTNDINKALCDLANKIERRQDIVQVDKLDLVLNKLDKLIELLTPDTRELIKHYDKKTRELTWVGWLHEDRTITTEWESKL